MNYQNIFPDGVPLIASFGVLYSIAINILLFCCAESEVIFQTAYSKSPYITALIKKIITISALYPKKPIAYPTGITSSPSPNDADIAKFAVLVVERTYPKSCAIEKKSAYIAERAAPDEITPAYDTNWKYPKACKNTINNVDMTRALSRIRRRY